MAEGPFAALSLQASIAECWRLAGSAGGVVYPFVAPVAEAFRVIRRLNRGHRVRDTGLHSPFPCTERISRAILAERCLVPDTRRILVSGVAETVLKGLGNPERRRVLRAGLICVVEAEFPHQAQSAVPTPQRVCSVVLLVVSRIADAFRHVSGILPRICVGGTQAVPHVVRAG